MSSLQVFMSRRPHGTAVGLIVALALALAPTQALAAPSDDELAEAQAAYKEGEKAYRLGNFGEAAEAFERAYAGTSYPDILYNIGLAHLRWYDVEPDVGHLRKAKVVLQNYILEIQKDPELGDLGQAETMIAEIDAKIDAAAQAEAEQSRRPEPGGTPADAGSDPGKGLRLGGSIAMGVGGAMIVAGVVSGVVLGVRGQSFENDLANAYDAYDAAGCGTGDVRPACDALNDEISTYRDNGQLANALAVGLGLSLGGVGLIGIVSGAVLFAQGNKKTARWERAELSLTPNGSRWGGGLTISGKF